MCSRIICCRNCDCGNCWNCEMESNALEYSSVDVYCSEIVTEYDEEIDVWEIDDDGIPF